MLKGPLASLERHDRPACEGRSGSERSTEPGSSAKTVASQPVVGYRIRSRTAKKEILVEKNAIYNTGLGVFVRGGGSWGNRVGNNTITANTNGAIGVCYNPAGDDPEGPRGDLVHNNLIGVCT